MVPPEAACFLIGFLLFVSLFVMALGYFTLQYLKRKPAAPADEAERSATPID